MSSFILDEHQRYLADLPRVAAFRQAIAEVVKPGDTVLDLGAGTGILGLLACQAGAGRVYAVDDGGMVQAAREVCRANGFEDRIIHIKAHSTRMELPEPVDVIVADQIGGFGLEAGLLEYFSDARDRFLKPHGRAIPGRLELYLAPVEQEAMWNRVAFWTHWPAGFDFQPVGSHAVNTVHPAKYQESDLLSEPAVIASLDVLQAPAVIAGRPASFTARRAGRLHGLGGWFSALLSPKVALTNSPLAKDAIDRHGVFFPLREPVSITKGDRLDVRMSLRPADGILTWKVEVYGADAGQRVRKATESHSTFEGLLLAGEDLRKTQPTFVPRLSPWGEARLSVLSLCNGERPMAEVEEEVYRRHPKLFRSPDDAARFVREVITPSTL